MTYSEWRSRRDYTPDEVLDKLCAAGLGEQDPMLITEEQYTKAMRGEKVEGVRSRFGPARKRVRGEVWEGRKIRAGNGRAR